jgi:hypothetical protein
VLKIGSKEISYRAKGIEGKKEIDVAPFIVNGSTMIPLRGLLELMGAEITWYGDDQSIDIDNGSLFIHLQIDNKLVYVKHPALGDIRYTLLSIPVIVEGRTFIPLRFVSEQLGYNVSWNGDGMTVKITYADETTETLTLDLVDFFDYEDSTASGCGMTGKGFLCYHIETYYDNNGSVEEYIVYIFDRQITVKADAILLGDVNSDGSVDNLDCLILTRYLANWDGYTEADINMAASDVNQDDSVDNLDCLILTRHLANWEGYEVLGIN